MNNQETLARQWAESKLAMPTSHLDADVIAAAEHILATTTPPTMADVVWDGGKHHLAGATDDAGTDVVMLWPSGDDVDIVGTDLSYCGHRDASDLTPNGKRYRLVEVTDDDPEPSHPEVLRTVEDYENAREGTIVASDGYLSTPLVKRYGKWCRDRIEFTAEDLGAVPEQLRVLRWGWGE